MKCIPLSVIKMLDALIPSEVINVSVDWDFKAMDSIIELLKRELCRLYL